jgi:putative CocE/NonD family hydrolase
MRRYMYGLLVLLSLLLVAGAVASASVSAPSIATGRSAAASVVEVAQNAAAPQAIQDADGEYSVMVAENVMVPMRDDVELAADIYFPAEDGEALEGPWPVVLTRTPYGKSGSASDGHRFASHGYVYVAQDTRGRYASDGTFYVYTQEADDGYDTVLWVNDQPWANGQIGLIGGSYLAATANAIIVQDAPGLEAAFITISSSNYHEDGAWQGGAFELSHNVGYALSLAAAGHEASANSGVDQGLSWARETDNFADELLISPLAAGSSPFALAPSYDEWFQDWQGHDLYDEYWQQNGLNVEEYFADAADIPIMLVGGWYDRFLRGTVNNYLGYSEQNESPTQLVLNASTHGGQDRTTAGNVSFGEDNPAGTDDLALQWFDHWLKDVDNDVQEADLVRAFRMDPGDGTKNSDGQLQASGEWREFDTWPPSDVEYTEFYLTPDMGLQTDMPDTGSLTYTYDPTDPVPTVGGNMTSGGDVAPPGPYDQSCREDLPVCENTLPLNDRSDILSFTTPPLEEDMEVTGPLSVQLWISSSAVDSDFTAKLVDVFPPSPDYPDGFEMNLADSIVRARFRSFEQLGPDYHRTYAIAEEPLEPGEMYDVTIDLWDTSHVFRAGHQIRVDISSSNFPRFDANPNTGEPFAERHLPPVVAQNTVYTGEGQASHVLLPVRSESE